MQMIGETFSKNGRIEYLFESSVETSSVIKLSEDYKNQL